MKNFYDIFCNAIDTKTIVLIRFNSIEKGEIVRQCIPFDFAPARGDIQKPYKYQTYDLDSGHNLAIAEEQIIDIQPTTQHFNPEQIVTWHTNWFYKRNWGSKS